MIATTMPSGYTSPALFAQIEREFANAGVICSDEEIHTEAHRRAFVGPAMPAAISISRGIARNVRHPKFGRGRVLRADDRVARIQFADHGVKDMSLTVATLELIDAAADADCHKSPTASAMPKPKALHHVAAKTPPAADSAGRITYRRASDIQAKPIHWLWLGRIARGKVSMLAGNPGLGKSQVTASMAAVVTTGGTWPVDRSRCERGNVIFLSAEDDPEDTIRPRLEAAGADLSRVFILDAVVEAFNAEGGEIKRAFNLKTDLARLGRMLDEIGGAAMIVIDPITAYLGETDSHKNAEIRALLSPLSDLAAKHGAAVVCVSHLNKSAGGEALMRVTGSLAFVAAARAAFIVAKDPENDARRLFLPMKNNIGNDRSGLAFAIESAQVKSPAGLIETSRIAWEPDPVTVTADEAMTPQGDPEERSALDDARQFLLGLLADGPVRAGQIKSDADGAGFNMRTIQRAADRLNIERHKDGMRGGWTWKLPPKMTNTPEDDRHKTVSPSENLVAFGRP